jgi:hypothetical protein
MRLNPLIELEVIDVGKIGEKAAACFILDFDFK